MAEPRRRWAAGAMDGNDDEEAFLMEPSSNGDFVSRKRDKGRRSDHFLPIMCGLVLLLLLSSVCFYLLCAQSLPCKPVQSLKESSLPYNTSGLRLPKPSTCDTIDQGYQCQTEISHSWGQYSPYFRVPSEISPTAPDKCVVTFVQLISRHGARYPTIHKSKIYAKTITRIQSTARNLTGSYAFLQKYTYDLGGDDLTDFGRQEMVKSGIQFFTTYPNMVTYPTLIAPTPFIRASDSQRVIESAQLFSKGYHRAKTASGATNDSAYPYPILTISESESSNNTLSHTICPAFTSLPGYRAQKTFLRTFLPAITTRLSSHLAMSLTPKETIYLMDLCPFTTAASPNPQEPNPFCALFSPSEWESYSYYQTLGKYYGHGSGNPLGATQGVGYVNELIARMTQTPVNDCTSVNHTLDSDPSTFPFNRGVYADFGHDNGMASIFAALGLFNNTLPLDQLHMMDLEETKGFSAATTTPFAGRAVVEMMSCAREGPDDNENIVWMVRVVMNGRVLPLEWCGGNGEGCCTVEKFVEGLAFAREGGRSGDCYGGADEGGVDDDGDDDAEDEI